MAHKLLALVPRGPPTAAARAKQQKRTAPGGADNGVNASEKENGAADGGHPTGDSSHGAAAGAHAAPAGTADDDEYRRLIVFVKAGETVANLKERILTQYRKLYSRDGTSVPRSILHLKDAEGFICDDEYIAADCFAPGSKVYAERPVLHTRKRRNKVKTEGGRQLHNDGAAGDHPEHGEGEGEEDQEDEGDSAPETAVAPAVPLPSRANARNDDLPKPKKQKAERLDKASDEGKATKTQQRSSTGKLGASAAASTVRQRDKEHAPPSAVTARNSGTKKASAKNVAKKEVFDADLGSDEADSASE